jgi:hypothetical protein
MSFYRAKKSEVFMDQQEEDTASCKQKPDEKCEYQIFFHEKEHDKIDLRSTGLKNI